MGTTNNDDNDITSVRGMTASFGTICRYERVRQDRRVYYRLLINGRSGGSLTDAKHARETIAYWREKGWISV